jgi:hypothetical protein
MDGRKPMSYQQLASQLDENDLFSVLGDEDNPVHAVPFCNPDGKCN